MDQFSDSLTTSLFWVTTNQIDRRFRYTLVGRRERHVPLIGIQVQFD
jgi:hypothetical protein